MTNTNILSLYIALNQSLTQQQIGITASELHGLMTGLICGGNSDPSWLTLVHNLTNEGMAFSEPLSSQLQSLYQMTRNSLEEDGFTFQLLIPDEEIALFDQIDDLAGWVNHFLLGLGVSVPKLDEVNGEMAELINDLRGIGQLGYDEDESAQELEKALIEVSEYVRMAAMVCYNEFNATYPLQDNEQPIIH